MSLGAFATGNAQNINLKLNNTSVEHILEEVSKQSKLRLFYDQQILKNLRIRQINFKNASVNTVLNKTFNGKNLSFKIIDGTIVITEKEQTDFEIKGVATDVNGPLQGVTISLTGNSTINTITDADGRYTLRVPENSTVVFRYLGYSDQEFQINQNRTLNVQMVTSSSELEEVVVVGYGTQKKANLTGAVDQIDSKRLEKFKTTNLGEALAGQVPNLNIGISDGKPGRGASFNIRGNTSINGGSPLILLDGVPISSFELNNISPQTIDNISFLKDASSAAIYGARAAYGVILVTTKE